MAELAERPHNLYPPVQIVREFEFKDAVPAEYNWLIRQESDRTLSLFHYTLDLPGWHKIVPLETTHAIPEPPDPL